MGLPSFQQDGSRSSEVAFRFSFQRKSGNHGCSSWFELVRFGPDRTLAARLISELFHTRTDVLRTDSAMLAIARLGRWINAEVRSTLLTVLLDSPKKQTKQGAGELAVFFHIRCDDPSAARTIEDVLGQEERADDLESVRLGIAFACTHLCKDADYRNEAIELGLTRSWGKHAAQSVVVAGKRPTFWRTWLRSITPKKRFHRAPILGEQA